MTHEKAYAMPTELSETTLETAAGGSGHPGGIQVALGDGSVRFIKNDTTSDGSESSMDLPVLNIQRAR